MSNQNVKPKCQAKISSQNVKSEKCQVKMSSQNVKPTSHVKMSSQNVMKKRQVKMSSQNVKSRDKPICKQLRSASAVKMRTV